MPLDPAGNARLMSSSESELCVFFQIRAMRICFFAVIMHAPTLFWTARAERMPSACASCACPGRAHPECVLRGLAQRACPESVPEVLALHTYLVGARHVGPECVRAVCLLKLHAEFGPPTLLPSQAGARPGQPMARMPHPDIALCLGIAQQ